MEFEADFPKKLLCEFPEKNREEFPQKLLKWDSEVGKLEEFSEELLDKLPTELRWEISDRMIR